MGKSWAKSNRGELLHSLYPFQYLSKTANSVSITSTVELGTDRSEGNLLLSVLFV